MRKKSAAFIVGGKEEWLRKGELKRADGWVKEINSEKYCVR